MQDSNMNNNNTRFKDQYNDQDTYLKLDKEKGRL